MSYFFPTAFLVAWLKPLQGSKASVPSCLVRKLSPDASHIDHASIARVYCHLEPTATPPGAVDEETSAAINTADIAETPVAKQSFSLRAADWPAAVEAGTNPYIDVDPLGRRGRGTERQEEQGKAELGSKRVTHDVLH